MRTIIRSDALKKELAAVRKFSRTMMLMGLFTSFGSVATQFLFFDTGMIFGLRMAAWGFFMSSVLHFLFVAWNKK